MACIFKICKLKEFEYLISGAGIQELIFANTILGQSNSRIALADPYSAPGGHWHRIAEFSRLSPPYNTFGLPDYSIQDWHPLQKSYSRKAVLAYCAEILQHRLLASGRVSYFPECEVQSDGKIISVQSGAAHDIKVTHRIVAAEDMGARANRPHIPCFSYTNTIDLVHPRHMPSHHPFHERHYEAYCVIGAGRTATDAALFLLREGIPPNQIRWVKSRECWVLSSPPQDSPQPDFDVLAAVSLNGLRQMSQAHSIEALCVMLNQLGLLQRTSSDLAPEGFSPYIITHQDAAELRRLERTIRKGHVHAISEIGMVLDQGVVPMPLKTLYIDATRGGGSASKPEPVFQDSRIHLADVSLCQSSFSAAIVAAIELLDASDQEKNALCAPMNGSDLAALLLTTILNMHAWFHHEELRKWLETCRLDRFLQSAARQINTLPEIPPMLKKIRAVLPRAIINLEQLLERAGIADPLID